MSLRSKDYYMVYTSFRKCLDVTNKEDVIIVNQQRWSVADLINVIENKSSEHRLKMLLSLTLPYAGQAFEQEMDERGFELLSDRVLIYSMVPGYSQNYATLTRYLEEFKKNDRWKILKCVLQVYYNLKTIF